jgi:hypothetical protein
VVAVCGIQHMHVVVIVVVVVVASLCVPHHCGVSCRAVVGDMSVVVVCPRGVFVSVVCVCVSL